MCSYGAVASHILRWRSYSESMWNYFFGIGEAIKRVCRTSSASPRKHACMPARVGCTQAQYKIEHPATSTMVRLSPFDLRIRKHKHQRSSVSARFVLPPALCCKDERSNHTEIVTGRISKQSRLSQCSRQERPGHVATLYDQGP